MSSRPRHIAGALLIVCVVWGASPAQVHATPHHPQRIVSLKPNITEILFALGAGDRVVGVSRWCDYPPAAAALPKVADYTQPYLEAVLALQSDLVIGSTENSLRAPIARLQQQGVRVLLLSFDSLDATFAAIRTIGRAIGAGPAARTLVQQLRRDLAPARTVHTTPPRVLLLVGTNPYVAAGPASLLSELLERAGAVNVITASRPLYPRIGLEQLLAASPDLVVLADHAPSPGRIATVPTRTLDLTLLRAGPRLGEGLRAMRNVLTTRSRTP